MQESSSGKERFYNPEHHHDKDDHLRAANLNNQPQVLSHQLRENITPCEERGISLIQRTSLKEETKKEEKLAESTVNISYDEQRVDLNILQRSQQAQQRHAYGLKSSLKLPLSYQEASGQPDLLLQMLSCIFLFYGIIVCLSVIMLVFSIWLKV